jgi:hypothetical protein
MQLRSSPSSLVVSRRYNSMAEFSSLKGLTMQYIMKVYQEVELYLLTYYD